MQTHLAFVKAFQSGKPVGWDDFVEHFDNINNAPPDGPAVGSHFPEFSLRDQHGEARSFADLRGPAGLLVVLVRSVLWCGYCRNQLAELDLAGPDLRAAGLGVVALAPDSSELIAEFAGSREIGFPLLRDPDAKLAEELGLLNHNLLGDPAEGGRRAPFPAQILLSYDGAVLARSVARDVRHRPSATKLVMGAMGPSATSAKVVIESEELRAEIFLSTNRVHTGQQVGITLRLEITPGWHVYGRSDGSAYAPLELEFDGALLSSQEVSVPPAPMFLDPASRETVTAYEGVIEATGEIQLAWSPPVHGSRHVTGLAERLAQMQMAPDAYELKGRLRYQACGEGHCSPPRTVPFAIPITIEADIDKTRALFRDERE